jgi:hypothetical protein
MFRIELVDETREFPFSCGTHLINALSGIVGQPYRLPILVMSSEVETSLIMSFFGERGIARQ